jgi:hypothetical protein
VKDLTIGLPPGMIGNPEAATAKCTVDELNADNCPDTSEVGSVTANATVTVVLVPVPVTVNGTLYNLEPQPGEPARGQLHDDELQQPRLSPAFTAEIGGPGQTTNGVPTTASTAILQDTDEAGLHDAVVKVPADLNPNASLFFGTACDQGSFQASNCPANTVVGLATAASLLLSQPRRQRLCWFPVAARFQLTFTNPPGLLGTSRDICTPPPPLFHADFTGYNGASTSVDSPATVDGCGPSTGASKAKCSRPRRSARSGARAACLRRTAEPPRPTRLRR